MGQQNNQSMTSRIPPYFKPIVTWSALTVFGLTCFLKSEEAICEKTAETVLGDRQQNYQEQVEELTRGMHRWVAGQSSLKERNEALWFLREHLKESGLVFVEKEPSKNMLFQEQNDTIFVSSFYGTPIEQALSQIKDTPRLDIK